MRWPLSNFLHFIESTRTVLPHLQKPPPTHHYCHPNASAYAHKFHFFYYLIQYYLTSMSRSSNCFPYSAGSSLNFICNFFYLMRAKFPAHLVSSCFNLFNPLALELDIYSLAHHLCNM